MAGHTPWRELQRRTALIHAGARRDAIDELEDAGYRPTSIQEAVRDAQEAYGFDHDAAMFFVTGHHDLVEVDDSGGEIPPPDA